MQDYRLTLYPEVIIRIVDTAFIPNDPGNKDYQEYLVWLTLGNTPLPAI